MIIKSITKITLSLVMADVGEVLISISCNIFWSNIKGMRLETAAIGSNLEDSLERPKITFNDFIFVASWLAGWLARAQTE